MIYVLKNFIFSSLELISKKFSDRKYELDN